jgi:hypothetical protein
LPAGTLWLRADGEPPAINPIEVVCVQVLNGKEREAVEMPLKYDLKEI